MTPSQTKKTRAAIASWVEAQRRKMGMTLDTFAELVGKARSTVSAYETGKIDAPFPVILTIAYEADCTIEETQELFAAYANIRAKKKKPPGGEIRAALV